MSKRLLHGSACLAGLALLVLPALAHGPEDQKAVLETRTDQELGPYLVGSDQHALYLFEGDTPGNGEQKAASACHDECEQAWPPVIAEGGPDLGEGIKEELVSTIERHDGQQQVTYNGWPLYYYAADDSPGHARGHDLEDFGAEWYLVTPEGEKVAEH